VKGYVSFRFGKVPLATLKDHLALSSNCSWSYMHNADYISFPILEVSSEIVGHSCFKSEYFPDFLAYRDTRILLGLASTF